MNQNFTEAVAGGLQSAFSQAKEMNHTEVTENHLLSAFLEDPQGYFHSVLSALKTHPDELQSEVSQNLQSLPTFSGASQEPAVARSLQGRISDAGTMAKQMNDSYISTDHFLLAYWKNGGDPFLSWKDRTTISLKDVDRAISESSREPF